MKFEFFGLIFEIADQKIYLTDCLGFAQCRAPHNLGHFGFCEVQLAGENHAVHGGSKLFESSERNKLRYVSHTLSDRTLSVTQESELVRVVTTFSARGGAIRVETRVSNIASRPVTVEHAATLVLYGFGARGAAGTGTLFLHRFYNSWHVECQPVRLSLHDLGLFNGNGGRSMKRVSGCNIGSWSTKEELPQALLEDAESGKLFFFDIESNNSWYWEIGDNGGLLYLNLGGGNATFTQYAKTLAPGESLDTVPVAIAAADSLNDLLARVTRYRRTLLSACAPDRDLPVIYNEYMHLSWDNPDERRTARVAPVVGTLGAKYYVIDCGWHDDCDYTQLYKRVGKWEPSSVRFPGGIEKTVAAIEACGMKAGLWLEPEIIGCECDEMEAYYGEECFLSRYGKKIVTSNRKFLDFRNKKVTDYLTDVIDRIVGYGVGYLKFDYNQDCGPGTDRDSDSLGDGLEQCSRAFLDWVRAMMARHPGLIIETCASGGQRLDYRTLSVFPLVSTSDQTDYRRYPYIAGNILSAVLPEQAAVWSYPVASLGMDRFDDDTEESVAARITDDQVITNMVNAMLGRMHLASAVHLLSEDRRALIREAVAYYDSIVPFKRTAVPYLPWGFTHFGAPKVVAGLVGEGKAVFAVWNLGGDGDFAVDLPEYTVRSARIAYPARAADPISFDAHGFRVRLPAGSLTARIIELTL